MPPPAPLADSLPGSNDAALDVLRAGHARWVERSESKLPRVVGESHETCTNRVCSCGMREIATTREVICGRMIGCG